MISGHPQKLCGCAGSFAVEAVKLLYKAACLASCNKKSCKALAERVLDIFNVAACSNQLLIQEGHWEHFVKQLCNKLQEMQIFVDSFSSHGEPCFRAQLVFWWHEKLFTCLLVPADTQHWTCMHETAHKAGLVAWVISK